MPTTDPATGTDRRTYFPLVPSGKSAVTVSELGTISVEKLNAVGGGVSAVHLNRDEALNLFAALAAVLGRTAVGNFVPVWERQ